MNQAITRWKTTALAAAIAFILPTAAMADSAYDALKRQVEILQKQLEQVQQTMKEYEQQAATKEEVKEVRQEVAEVSSLQSEWKNTDSVVHLAGYGDVTYSDGQGDDVNGAFTGARFNPIFHYQYKDLVMLEGELEFEVEDDGATNTALEYLTVDLFVNDNLALIGGKFLSPVGQFRQNLHPSWINKLPTAPSGFGHDQAAPLSEMGLQARGGFPVKGTHVNYAAYVGNGPVLEISSDDHDPGTPHITTHVVEAVEATGRTSNDNDKLIVGGRLGVTPWANSELGISAATGEIAGEDEPNASRDYDVYGVDAGYKWRNLGLRGEFVKQKVGSESSSVAPGSAEWQAWYAQAAYRFMPTRFEGVVRYSDYDAHENSMDQEQWAVGVNFLFAPNAMAKLAYNFNDGDSGSTADDDTFQLQFAYGF